MAADRRTLHLGTSGWHHDDGAGPVYPTGLPPGWTRDALGDAHGRADRDAERFGALLARLGSPPTRARACKGVPS